MRELKQTGATIVAMALSGTLFLPAAAGAEGETTEAMGEIQVIGVTPSHGVGLPVERIPTNVQTATSEDLERAQALDLTDFMNRNLGSVNTNAAQNNPLQPDVQYRGFTASPLLGLPQGLAVYQNGVRVNEAFGDTVNWDLIPKSAIDSINLIGGANPIFGLNTLGGALSIQTRNGFTWQGTEGKVEYGSFNRLTSTIATGGNNGTWGWFLSGDFFKEDGWRDKSDSDAWDAFAALSWQNESSTLDLIYSHGDSNLKGNGPVPVELLALDREAGFTFVDITENLMNLIDLEGTHWFNDSVQLSGNAFYRWNNTSSFNGDGTPYVACSDVGLLFQEDDVDPTAAGDPAECDAAADHAGATPITDQFGANIAATNNAINNLSQRNQRSYGANLQLTFLQDLLRRENQLITGVAIHRGVTDFASRVQIAALLADRSTSRNGALVPAEDVRITTSTRTLSAYFTDTFALTDSLDLTVAGRYNATKVKVGDRNLANYNPALNGEHDYERFNPAVGLTWQATEALNLYGSYSESSRAPTPVELSCADPNAPCSLPNAFLADPPLQQVVAESWEAGLRGQWREIDWHLGGFWTTNKDDIIFQSTGGTTGNIGFFDNIGNTLRRGIELGLSGSSFDHLSWFLNYSFVDATFDDPFLSNSPSHPLADANGNIQVQGGDRIPGIPQHTLKIGGDYAFSDALSVGADINYNSDQYLRGDEANLLDTVDGYVVVNLHGSYRVNDHVTLLGRINNLFDSDYESFGLLGEPGEVFDGSGPGFSPAMSDPRFLGPGAPIGGWLGVKIAL